MNGTLMTFGNDKEQYSNMNHSIHYNGLESDYKTFAKFVYIFETQIRLYNSLSEFSIKFHRTADYFYRSVQKYILYTSIDKINGIGELVKKGKQTLFFTKSKYQLYDFCRHLRNSFCHALIQRNETVLSVPDMKGKKILTSKGSIEYPIAVEFFRTLIAEYESNITNELR